MSPRGYFGIGIWHGKKEVNVGTLWRSAHSFGAAFIFTVGRRYRQQASDTTKAWRHIPLVHFATVDDLVAHVPYDCPLIGIELDDRATPLGRFVHPERAVYLLGAEDSGLSEDVRRRCFGLVQVDGADRCLNVSVAGSIVMHHRTLQRARRER